jgi:hypothetical protein
MLTFDIMRAPNSGADVQAAYDLSRWPRCAAERRHDAYKGSRDASFFQSSGNQTHGLMTNGSAGDKQGGFDTVRFERSDNFRNGFVDEWRHVGL